MPLVQNRKIVHRFFVEEHLGAPPAYRPIGQATDFEEDCVYRAIVTFGSDRMTIQENFKPQLRGLKSPRLFLGSRANDISEEIARTWSGGDVEITMTSVGHASANAGYDGLIAAIKAEAVRGIFWIGNLSLHLASVKIPFLSPMADPASHAMQWVSHFAADHVLQFAGMQGVLSGVSTGLTQKSTLLDARDQDELVFKIIGIKFILTNTAVGIAQRLHRAQAEYHRLMTTEQSKFDRHYPAVTQASNELLGMFEEVVTSLDYQDALRNIS